MGGGQAMPEVARRIRVRTVEDARTTDKYSCGGGGGANPKDRARRRDAMSPRTAADLSCDWAAEAFGMIVEVPVKGGSPVGRAGRRTPATPERGGTDTP